MSRIGEICLLYMSKDMSQAREGRKSGGATGNEREPLSILAREFGGFGNMVAGKKVVDFGSGEGYQSVALVAQYGCEVVGVEPNGTRRRKAEFKAATAGISRDRLRFVGMVADDMIGKFDIAISQNSFEHFAKPGATLNILQSLLHPQGKLLITFGPPWLAPYGSHMYFFCPLPWVNILFSESTVLNVRKAFRDDGADRYEDVEQGLNRMTLAKFERLVAATGMHTELRRYTGIRGINFLSRIPTLRELFVNHVSVILSRTDNAVNGLISGEADAPDAVDAGVAA